MTESGAHLKKNKQIKNICYRKHGLNYKIKFPSSTQVWVPFVFPVSLKWIGRSPLDILVRLAIRLLAFILWLSGEHCWLPFPPMAAAAEFGWWWVAASVGRRLVCRSLCLYLWTSWCRGGCGPRLPTSWLAVSESTVPCTPETRVASWFPSGPFA